MSKKSINKIKAGLDQAVGVANGKVAPAKITVVETRKSKDTKTYVDGVSRTHRDRTKTGARAAAWAVKNSRGKLVVWTCAKSRRAAKELFLHEFVETDHAGSWRDLQKLGCEVVKINMIEKL